MPVAAGIVPSIGSMNNALVDSAIGSTSRAEPSIRIGPTPGADVPMPAPFDDVVVWAAQSAVAR